MANKVLVTVVEARGHCGHGHKLGETFEIEGTRTNGKPCLEVASNLYWNAVALTNGAKLPWARGKEKDVTYVACPDPVNTIVFEVKKVSVD